jgi:hypothetical protein
MQDNFGKISAPPSAKHPSFLNQKPSSLQLMAQMQRFGGGVNNDYQDKGNHIYTIFSNIN